MSHTFPKIDIFSHILPNKYRKGLYSKIQRSLLREEMESTREAFPALSDIELRLNIIDKHEGLRQVLTIAGPPVEYFNPNEAVELARLANDEMADLIAKYPDHFVSGVACLPMNDIEATLREAERAIKVLNMKGVQILTPCNGRALDSPVFFPLYEMMAKYNLPIWLHPVRDRGTPDYIDESYSKYKIYQAIGWPYETTVAMVRLVLSGVLERYASLKIITHHCGGLVPYLAGRLSGTEPPPGKVAGIDMNLSRPLLEYFKMFYTDTILSNNMPGLMCGYAFFGAEHIMFGTDMPIRIEQKISSVDQMAIPASDKYSIFEGNAKKLLHI
ncbi:amidohydrolase family protein [Chloroflexota bacterium]